MTASNPANRTARLAKPEGEATIQLRALEDLQELHSDERGYDPEGRGRQRRKIKHWIVLRSV